MKTWFTADWHLNHENIIRYCKRPFNDVLEMEKALIEGHNKRVKKGDVCYFLFL